MNNDGMLGGSNNAQSSKWLGKAKTISASDLIAQSAHRGIARLQRGFTLVELIVVVIVISILAQLPRRSTLRWAATRELQRSTQWLAH